MIIDDKVKSLKCLEPQKQILRINRLIKKNMLHDPFSFSLSVKRLLINIPIMIKLCWELF